MADQGNKSNSSTGQSKRGFASMSTEERSENAKKGGQSSSGRRKSNQTSR